MLVLEVASQTRYAQKCPSMRSLRTNFYPKYGPTWNLLNSTSSPSHVTTVYFGCFQFTLVQTVQTTLVDAFPNRLARGRRPQILLLCICSSGFLLGLPLTTSVSAPGGLLAYTPDPGSHVSLRPHWSAHGVSTLFRCFLNFCGFFWWFFWWVLKKTNCMRNSNGRFDYTFDVVIPKEVVMRVTRGWTRYDGTG